MKKAEEKGNKEAIYRVFLIKNIKNLDGSLAKGKAPKCKEIEFYAWAHTKEDAFELLTASTANYVSNGWFSPKIPKYGLIARTEPGVIDPRFSEVPGVSEEFMEEADADALNEAFTLYEFDNDEKKYIYVEPDMRGDFVITPCGWILPGNPVEKISSEENSEECEKVKEDEISLI